MNNTTIKYELQNIISGKSEVSYGESIQTITRYLRESRGTSEKNKGDESSKSEETKKLMDYINANHLWSCDIAKKELFSFKIKEYDYNIKRNICEW
jgi:hypothetical protein